MIYVYVLLSKKDKGLYVGLTKHLERRIKEHNSGKNRSTKSRIPFELLIVEEYDDYPSAREREKYLKSGIGREYIKQYAGII